MADYPYNLTSMTDQVGLYGFLDAANTLSGGLFGVLILVVVFVIMVVAWKSYEPKRSFAAASFITSILAIFLRLLGWIPDAAMFITFLIAGITFVLLNWT